MNGKYLHTFHKGSFFGIFRRNKAAFYATMLRIVNHRQYAVNWTNGAVQREFSSADAAFQRVFGKCGNRCKDTQRNRQVKGCAFLFGIGRGKVDCDALDGERQSGIAYCCTYPFAGFLNSGIRQPDDVKGGQTIAQVDLNGNGIAFDSQ